MLKSIVNGAEHDIVSIPMKGKNLFDPNFIVAGRISGTTGDIEYSSNTTIHDVSTNSITFSTSVAWRGFTTDFVQTSNKLRVSIGSFTGDTGATFNAYQYAYAQDKSFLGFIAAGSNAPEGTQYIRVSFQCNIIVTNAVVTNIMLNTGSTALPYEPYGYQNGWEVRDNQNRLIWGREDELQTITGTLPFKGYDLPIKVESLLGNATQNGTPSPDNVVIPEFCGVRTDNLFDDSTAGYGEWVNSDGTIEKNIHYAAFQDYNVGNTVSFIAKYNGIKPYSYSVVFYNSNGDFISREHRPSPSASYDMFDVPSGSTEARYQVAVTPNTQTMTSAILQSMKIMLNEGSTPLQYEPYGYKITFNNNGENLFDKSLLVTNTHLDNTTGLPVSYPGRITLSDPVDVSQYSTVTISYVTSATINAMYSIFSNNELVGRFTAVLSGTAIDVSNADKMYICFYSTYGGNIDTSNVSDIMLNIGSTPLPYSPYLNKTTPIYLGEVPTIRRIKKLVLTGEEKVYLASTDDNRTVCRLPLKECLGNFGLCTHIEWKTPYQDTEYDRLVWNDFQGGSLYISISNVYLTSQTAQALKSYLAAQYQNGTPITVWYVLSEPEIGIVNEPLCKIGDHADELTELSVHELSAPLYGIGDYKDTLNLSTGVVTRNIKKLVLTSATGGWSYNSTYSRYTFRINDSLIVGVRLSPVACSHFVPISDGRSLGDVPNNAIYSNAQQTTNNWFIKTEDYTTASSFGQFLDDELAAGRPVTVWYVLATSETETVTVPTGMTGEVEGYLTQISTPTPTNPSIPKWNGEEETGGTYAVTVYTPPVIQTTTGKNTLTVDTTLAPYNVTINGHIKYTYWGKIREDVRSGLAQTKFPVGTILYDNEDESTGRAFQVVGYDKHFDPSLTARGYNHSMTLCQLKLSGPWQFDATEAFLYTTVEMQPGTYKFKIPNYDTTYGGNKTYYFTSTASVPADSHITLSWAYQQPPKTVTAYAGPNPQTNTTAITGFNALQLSEWIEGESPEAIDLGTIKLANNDPDSTYGKLNHIHRARYGSNNYYQSGLRQLLNTDLASNNWWHPTTIFDRPYANRTTNGYLRSLNEDFINVLATPEITHIANNIFEYPSLDGRTFTLNTEYKINTDKVFLLSHTEVGLSASPNIGTVLDYYSTHNTNNDRIKYRIDNGNAYYWWFRTPYPTNANSFRSCHTSGALNYYGAINNLGVAPAHIIQ